MYYKYLVVYYYELLIFIYDIGTKSKYFKFCTQVITLLCTTKQFYKYFLYDKTYTINSFTL